MTDPIISPFQDAFGDFWGRITTTGLLCSPYITQSPIRALVSSLRERGLQETVALHVLTDISLVNLVQGATDLRALLYLQEHLPQVRISYLPRLHAKVYIADERMAIVGSANFTEGGSSRNYEYGIRTDDAVLVTRICNDINGYAALGGEATQEKLAALQEQIAPLREAIREGQNALRRQMSALLKEKERETQDNLIRIRVGNRSLNAIFADTIIYLLSRRRMTTIELNNSIQHIHPDLCNDSLDRVIDGRHFGKLWKHQVRGAQVFLRRGGRIDYDKETGLWRVV